MSMQNKGQNIEKLEISNFLYEHMFQISCLWFAEFLIDFKKKLYRAPNQGGKKSELLLEVQNPNKYRK